MVSSGVRMQLATPAPLRSKPAVAEVSPSRVPAVGLFADTVEPCCGAEWCPAGRAAEQQAQPYLAVATYTLDQAEPAAGSPQPDGLEPDDDEPEARGGGGGTSP